jgi:hypothetical protein
MASTSERGLTKNTCAELVETCQTLMPFSRFAGGEYSRQKCTSPLPTITTSKSQILSPMINAVTLPKENKKLNDEA